MNQHFKDTVFSAESTWGGVVADLRFEYGDLHLKALTVSQKPTIDVSGGWVQVVGTSSVGGFNLYLPADLCLSVLEAADPVLDIAELDSTAAALVFEHVTTKPLSELEEVLGADLSISKIVDVSQPVTERIYGLNVEQDGKHYPAAISVSGKLHEWFEIVVGQYSNPHERELDERLIVHLGPVVIASRQAYLVRMGEKIDCGVQPSDVIKGVLMRQDGYYWPIFIEDNEIEISQQMAGPVNFSHADDTQVFATFGIGDVSVTAAERVKLAPGHRLKVNRIENNGANIYYQAKPFARGHLAICGENLAVEIDKIGSFQE